MNELLVKITKDLLEPANLNIVNYVPEQESQEYGACRFEINGLKIISRNAKITPKKMGQFVTIWKRSVDGITQPFDTIDDFDLLIINVQNKEQLGQFVFSKSILSDKGIISTTSKEGKRGFRLYPPWDKPTSKQAIKTQDWQVEYFLLPSSKSNAIKTIYETELKKA